jgi:hypothetical protein
LIDSHAFDEAMAQRAARIINGVAFAGPDSRWQLYGATLYVFAYADGTKRTVTVSGIAGPGQTMATDGIHVAVDTGHRLFDLLPWR